jgi:serine/threonine protein phosphatase PrpC
MNQLVCDYSLHNMTLQSGVIEKDRGENSFLEWGICSMQGLRPSHEDAYIAEGSLIKDSLSMFAVFDGHGGSKCSKFLAKNFTDLLESHLANNISKKATVTDILRNTSVIRDSFFEIDDEFKGKVAPLMDIRKTSGSTANVVFVENCATTYEITCANVGDSRCLVFDRGQIFALSKDHKPTDPEEKKRIEHSGGYVERNRLDGHLAVSRAFGDFEDKCIPGVPPTKQPLIVAPDLRPLSVPKIASAARGDQFIIVACDGLFESMNIVQVCNFAAQELECGLPAQTAARRLAERAIELGSTDNVTCIVIVLKPLINLSFS